MISATLLRLTTIGMLGALASCETQSGAALQVSFAPGSIDHLEFYFAKAKAPSPSELRAIPQFAPAIQPTVLLRDYAANDSVTVTASDDSFVYFVPSSATPKGNQVIVVGYLEGKPVSFDRETIVVSDARVNEYALVLASPAANQGLADFGREKYQCIAVKDDRLIDAVTRADDIDCDGAKTSAEPTCDIDVLDPKASDVESCDGRDSDGDCRRAPDRVVGFCAQRDPGGYCRLGSAYSCDDSSPTAAGNMTCDGIAPPSVNSSNAGDALCIDPALCIQTGASVLDASDIVPTVLCRVQFKAGESNSCSKFLMRAPLPAIGCGDADYIGSPDIGLTIQTQTQAMQCEYKGEVIQRTGIDGKTIPVTLNAKDGVRRVTMVRLKYIENVVNCDSEIPCEPVNAATGGLLRDTCQ